MSIDHGLLFHKSGEWVPRFLVLKPARPTRFRPIILDAVQTQAVDLLEFSHDY